MTVDSNFLSFFLEEATDILVEWEKSCLAFEQTEDREATESLYRAAHNLKSGSAAVGLAEFSSFLHHVEDLIARLLAGKIGNSPDLVRIFLDVQAVLSQWIQTLTKDPLFVPRDAYAKIDGDIGKLLSSTGAGTAGNSQAENAAPAAPPAKEDRLADAPMEETGVDDAGALGVSAGPAKAAASPVPGPVAASEAKAHSPNGPGHRPQESLRVAAPKLDALIQLVGELTTQQSIVWHARQNNSLNGKSANHAIQLMQKSMKELQNLALSLRMQPLQSLFQRLERASRDLARAQGKKLEVKTFGEHVELDRTVIERITEAMLHVVRNAVDHGVEEPEVRFDQNKHYVATLRFEGSQEPGGILITIADDGRGMDCDKILKKAIEKGLADPTRAYGEAEIRNFIFGHGFSTADKVTDVSGRGVGMDVVKTAVEAIGGSISVASTKGRGTSFAISLPASLSIIDSLIVEVDAQRYAIPVQDVHEIVDLGNHAMQPSESHGRLLSLRDTVIPVESLRNHLPNRVDAAALTLSGSPSSATGTTQPALLVKSGGEMLAFEIDRIYGQQPISLRSLPGGLAQIPGYTGGSILGDGDPCLVLNLPALAQHLRPPKPAGDAGENATPSLAASLTGTQGEDTEDHRYLVFHLQGKIMATALLPIREIIIAKAYDKVMGSAPPMMGCIDLRGEVIPVVHLSGFFHLPIRESPNSPLLILETNGAALAVMVDGVEAVTNLAAVDFPRMGAQGDAYEHLSEKAQDHHLGVGRYQNQLIAIVDLQSLLGRMQTGYDKAPDDAVSA